MTMASTPIGESGGPDGGESPYDDDEDESDLERHSAGLPQRSVVSYWVQRSRPLATSVCSFE